MDIRTCIEEISSQAFTYGRDYEVFGVNPRNLHQIRVRNDRGRKVWINSCCFADGQIAAPMVRDIIIRDDLADARHSAIEVDLILTSGERRWCWFATPASLEHHGDTLDGNPALRIHYGCAHQIIVSALDESIIATALNQIQRFGALLRCTMAIEPQADNDDSAEHNAEEQ